ncbi:M81 family metallopeptidase [Isosphaeraceae bacterium EP7]
MIRIAVGGLMHESNTFSATPTGLGGFESGGLEVGPGIRDRWGDAHHEVGGFFEGAKSLGFEAVPTLMAWATPSGTVGRDTYEILVDRLLNQIQAAGPLDAVLLALHGAMAVEGLDDADGETLARVRRTIGPDKPLIVTLDLHANVSEQMAAQSNALVAYQTYPHVDQRPRGLKAATLAYRAALGQIRPVQAISKPPMLIHLLAQETGRGPMAALMAQTNILASSAGILDASLLAGFPYADVPACGPTCVVVADGDAALARREASFLGESLWAARATLTAGPPGPAEAVALARQVTARPALLIDLGDNIGGGSAADSTVLLHELIRQDAGPSLVVLHDPAAAQACRDAGVGATVHLEVGGKADTNAPPVFVSGRVETLHDGLYVEEQARHGGIRLNDQGPTAVIRVPAAPGGEHAVVVNSLRHPPFSLGQITSLGLDPHGFDQIVVKAAVAYKAAYVPLGGTVIEVDTPGLTAANPRLFEYHRIRRPILPLDPGTVWTDQVPSK